MCSPKILVLSSYMYSWKFYFKIKSYFNECLKCSNLILIFILVIGSNDIQFSPLTFILVIDKRSQCKRNKRILSFPASGWPNKDVFSLKRSALQGKSFIKISAHQGQPFGGVRKPTNTQTHRLTDILLLNLFAIS